ncbi:MAG: HAMP domain-containing protein [Acidobacteria bacterium]|nr:HAMP domain-containing protein [Acidobacteriota bacterium]
MNLFFKIFLWFLTAMALMIGVAVFLTWTLQSDPVIGRFQNIARSQVKFHGETAAGIFESEGQTGLERFLGRLRELEAIRGVGIIDQNRKLIIDNGLGTADAREVAERAFLSDETESNYLPGQESVLAKSFALTDGRKFVLVVLWTRPVPPPFLGEPRVRYLRLAGLILTAILVCYVLARYLSSPIVKLGEAARGFAAGDLKTRVADKLGNRRDEFGKLAADFDEMAERIETLVTSEKRLTRDISHELRSPLARMNVALELAKQKAGSESQAIIARIETESERLNEMIGKLLTLSKLESGSAGVSMVRLDLGQLVREIAGDADFEAGANDRSVVIRNIEDCRLVGNDYLLRSAIENVVRNAVRYTAKDTTVELSLTQNGKTAEIVVEDHGGGVPEAEIENLFRPFYRVAEARERRSGGVGLGLAIARRAVQAHNGSIGAVNTADGLRVSIKLPLNGGHQ